jgi:hypothetical protein
MLAISNTNNQLLFFSMTRFRHSRRARAFIRRVSALQNASSASESLTSLEDILKIIVSDEVALRTAIANFNANEQRMNLTSGLVALFEAPIALRTIYTLPTPHYDAHFTETMFTLPSSVRRSPGAASTVTTMAAFTSNWSTFSEGIFSPPSWNNIVVAGGAITACLLPVEAAHTQTRGTLRDYFHKNAFPDSDIDVFIFGLSEEEVRDYFHSFDDQTYFLF